MSAERGSDDTLRLLLIVVAAIVLAPLVVMVVAMPMLGTMGFWMGGGMGGGFSPLWGLGMLVVWVVVLVGIGYLLYRGFAGDTGTAERADPALEELRLAYARGDLSEEEFEERRANLSRGDDE